MNKEDVNADIEMYFKQIISLAELMDEGNEEAVECCSSERTFIRFA